MIIFLSMIFVSFEFLSMIFNQYFVDVHAFGLILPFNISVVFFCCCFFILDIVTDLYDSKVADKIIYGKIICQLLFVSFGILGIYGADLVGTQLDQIISASPRMILNGVIASVIGYKATTCIMQKLKVKYDGRFIFFRYISSTIPGEIAFSFVFTVLSFSRDRSFREVLMVFFTLSIVKIVLSFVFSSIAIPTTIFIRRIRKKNTSREYISFT